MRTSIIIASIIAIAIAGALSLVLIWQSSNTQTNTASYYYSIHDNIDGLDQDNGFVTIRGQQYYMVTPQVNYPNDTEINFQSVSFSFPNGNRPALTPGGTIAESIVTFQDGNSYRLAAGISPDSAAISAVVLTNHVGPQAGLAIYEDRIKVLFSTQKHLEELKIVGLQESYHTGEQVRFSVIADGFDLYPCRDFTASIVGDEQPIFSVPAYNLSCPIPIEPERYELYYPQKGDQFGVVVNKAGTYRLTVQFGDESAQREFAVNPDLGYEIIHGKDTFHVGEQITFQIKTRQIQNVCTAPEYKIIEKDSGKTVWDVPSVVYPCPFSSGPQKIIESIVSFPNESVKTPIINKTGDYTILIIDGKNLSSLDFTVLDETTDIDGHPFYYYTINDTMNSIQGEGKKITFHDVEFTISPNPVTMNLGGFCGSGSFGASIQFSDGVREMLRMNIPEPECADRFTKEDLIKLTNHTDTQAGLTFSDGKVRLLVSSDSIIPENAVLKVSADSPCSWMSLYNYPHNELINRHDRTGRNALMIQASDENVDDVALLKKMLGAIQETYGFEPAEHEDNTWVKHIEATPQEQQKIWDWLKETSNAQFGVTEDSSFTSYFEYDEKHYQIVWAVC